MLRGRWRPLWFPKADWPLAPAPDPKDWPPFPFECATEGELRVLLDRDWLGERCDHRVPEYFMSCMMPKGHDTPHMPQSHENIHRVGSLIVRSIWRGVETLS